MSDIEFERRMNDQFAKNLFFFLNKYQYTQAAFAKQMNVSTATVSNWCNGLKSPRMDKIDHMCAIFNCSRSDLLEEKDIIRSQMQFLYLIIYHVTKHFVQPKRLLIQKKYPKVLLKLANSTLLE